MQGPTHWCRRNGHITTDNVDPYERFNRKTMAFDDGADKCREFLTNDGEVDIDPFLEGNE